MGYRRPKGVSQVSDAGSVPYGASRTTIASSGNVLNVAQGQQRGGVLGMQLGAVNKLCRMLIAAIACFIRMHHLELEEDTGMSFHQICTRTFR